MCRALLTFTTVMLSVLRNCLRETSYGSWSLNVDFSEILLLLPPFVFCSSNDLYLFSALLGSMKGGAWRSLGRVLVGKICNFPASVK